MNQEYTFLISVTADNDVTVLIFNEGKKALIWGLTVLKILTSLSPFSPYNLPSRKDSNSLMNNQ